MAQARQIVEKEGYVFPFGPLEHIDLNQATDLGTFLSSPYLFVLARVAGKLYQVEDGHENLEQLKSELPRPRVPCKVRWTQAPHYTRDDERRVQKILYEKHSRFSVPNAWKEHLERNGIQRKLASWSSLGYSMVIVDPQEPQSHRIFLSREQAEKILVLGMP